MHKRGRQELSPHRALGDYLQRFPDGRYIILRGKYKGAYADTVPRGYIRKFILTKCIDDLTPSELELFTHYGRKDEPMTAETPTLPVEEPTQETRALTTLPEVTESTTLDRLQQRGTPIELIYSYLLAGDYLTANNAFTTSLLENLHERLTAKPGFHVEFRAATLLEGTSSADYVRIATCPPDTTLVSLSLEGDSPKLISGNHVAQEIPVPISVIKSPHIELSVEDAVQSSILKLVDRLTEWFEQTLQERLNEISTGADNHTVLGIVPDLTDGTVHLSDGHTHVKGYLTIGVYAFLTQSRH